MYVYLNIIQASEVLIIYRTSYEALRDSLKLQLYRYGRCLSPCESWPSLENWWSRQNVGLVPEVGSSTEARVEGDFLA